MSDQTRAFSKPFVVGEWTVEPEWNRISRGADTAKLEPRVMNLLLTLAASAGRPMKREELLDAVWPDTTVNEEALSRSVSQLRRAFKDDSKSPRYVQTVHKEGYCLIAPVGESTQGPNAHSPERRYSAAMIVLGASIIVATAAIVAMFYLRSSGAEAVRTLTPITSDRGREIDPAVSPDGLQVAYLASTPNDYQLFVRAIAGGVPRQLTFDQSAKGHPVWSPDGTRVAYVAAAGELVAIHSVASVGGRSEKLIQLPAWSYGLDWSPDGRTLAYSDAGRGESAEIAFLDLATRTVRPLLGEAEQRLGGVKPVFSPDGKRLAHIRVGNSGSEQIQVTDLVTGRSMTLALAPQQYRGLDWHPDGESLIVSAKAGRKFGLWRVAAVRQPAPESLPVAGGELFNPSVSPDGRIVVEEVEQDRDIWRFDLRRSALTPIIESTADDAEPAYAGTGKQLAFVSDRSGHSEVWVRRPAMAARQLTRIKASAIRHLSWSANQNKLAFIAEEKGGRNIVVADSSSGTTQRVRRSANDETLVGWGRSGGSLYLLKPRSTWWELWRLDLADQALKRLPTPPLRAAAMSWDGAIIFAIHADRNRLIRIVPSSADVSVVPMAAIEDLQGLVVTRHGLYAVVSSPGDTRVHRLSLDEGRLLGTWPLEDAGPGGLAVSPEEPILAYTRARETSNDLAWLQL